MDTCTDSTTPIIIPHSKKMSRVSRLSHQPKKSNKLPHLPVQEIEAIANFVQKNRWIISQRESMILDRLIDDYEEKRSLEARQELKTFLLYLRRCVCPSPSAIPSTPKVVPQSDGFYSNCVLPQNQETPKRRSYYKSRRSALNRQDAIRGCSRGMMKSSKKTNVVLDDSDRETVFHQTFKLLKKVIRKRSSKN